VSKVGGIDDPVWTAPSGDDTQEGHAGRGRRLLVAALLAVLALGLVYLAAAAFLSRKDYGTFAFWKVPNRIDYCGRRYYDGGAQTGSPALFASQDSAQDAHWAFLSWTFGGRSIYADVAPPSPSAGSVCAMVLYIPIGGGKWETYSLSGGP
jgi:hypothetical protein